MFIPAPDAQVLVIEVCWPAHQSLSLCFPLTLIPPCRLFPGLLVHPRPVRPHRRTTHVVSRPHKPRPLLFPSSKKPTHHLSPQWQSGRFRMRMREDRPLSRRAPFSRSVSLSLFSLSSPAINKYSSSSTRVLRSRHASEPEGATDRMAHEGFSQIFSKC